jgi:ribosomal protein S18 acetylase RimI-like enzyme
VSERSERTISGATVTVRPAVPADYPAISRLTLAAYEADGQFEGAGYYPDMLADVAGRAGAGELLVAVSPQDVVLGAVLYVGEGGPFAELSRPDEAEFRMLAVDPSAQGRGVGRALVRACVERATAAGRTAVVICVRDIAVAAQKLYETFAFRRDPDLDWSPLPGVHLWGLRLPLNQRGDHGSDVDHDDRGLAGA